MRIFMVIIGVVAILLGGLWTAQGLNLMGQTGGMNGVKQRTRTVVELAAGLAFYARDGAPPMDDKAAAQMTPEARGLLARIVAALDSASVDWTESTLEAAVKDVAETAAVKLGQIAQPLRAALTGSTVSPGIFEVLAILGRDESLTRLRAAA